MAGNLEELMTNIDQLDANNPEHMEQLIQAISAGAVDPVEGTGATPAAPAKVDDKPADDTKATPAAEPAATEAKAEPASPATEDKAPVATRDGKNTIPYSVLEAAREGKARAEATAQQEREQREALAKQVEQNLARIKELEERGASTTAAEKAEVSDLKADLEAIAEEAPYLAGVLGKLIARVEATEKIAGEAKQAPKDETTDAPKLPPELRDAIDAVPAIAHWEVSNPKLFAAAAKEDDELKELPEWKNKPMKDRFEHVVKILAMKYGDSILPPADTQKDTTKPADKTLPKADEVAIHSISDIPGGTPTAQSALQDMENASPTALFNKLQSMDSPEDIIRFVTR